MLFFWDALYMSVLIRTSVTLPLTVSFLFFGDDLASAKLSCFGSNISWRFLGEITNLSLLSNNCEKIKVNT